MRRCVGETFTLEHAGMSATVEGMSGWRCEACGEVEFVPSSELLMPRQPSPLGSVPITGLFML